MFMFLSYSYRAMLFSRVYHNIYVHTEIFRCPTPLAHQSRWRVCPMRSCFVLR